MRRSITLCAGAPLLALLLGGCAGPTSHISMSGEIQGVLERQAAAWNDGDLESFMAAYWRSEELSFSSGGRVTHGWQETLNGYRRRYPDRATMGRLAFSDLEITPLGNRVSLVLGRWHLDRADPVGGAFSLVMRRDAGRWTILHDHTSRDTP